MSNCAIKEVNFDFQGGWHALGCSSSSASRSAHVQSGSSESVSFSLSPTFSRCAKFGNCAPPGLSEREGSLASPPDYEVSLKAE